MYHVKTSIYISSYKYMSVVFIVQVERNNKQIKTSND